MKEVTRNNQNIFFYIVKVSMSGPTEIHSMLEQVITSNTA